MAEHSLIDQAIALADELEDDAQRRVDELAGTNAHLSHNHWIGRVAAYSYIGGRLRRLAGRDPLEGVLDRLRVRQPVETKRRWSIRWEPRDIWVGLYWDRKADGLHLYVCLVPCIVLHVRPEARP